MDMIDIEYSLDNAQMALEHLYNARTSLTKARNWGVADIIAGGLFVSLAKRNNINQAEIEIKAAKTYINRLLAAFGDTTKITLMVAKIDDFFGATDAFFDNPISDVVVQNRISDSLAEVENTINKIEMIRNKLEMLK